MDGSGAGSAPAAARPPSWETTAILTQEPQELLGHLGAFAQAYRIRFGESPSQTLRRCRDRHLATS
ncbi:MAG: hypothetical protein ABWZ27_03770 [Aestuariivirgaceae bacterium]